MRAYETYAETLRRGLGVPHLVTRTIDSTNRLARTVIDNDGAARDPWRPCWLVAFEQQAGRGRLGRHWTSQAGTGIYATLLVELTSWDPRRISVLPLLVGTATAQALRSPVAGTPRGNEIRLKWPNDVVVSGRKLGGILIESVEREGRRFGIVGIGINHGHGPEDLPDPRATSLRLVYSGAGVELPSLGDTTVGLCRGVTDAVENPQDDEQVLETYRGLSAHRPGDQLSWSSHEGPVDGRFVEIDRDGAIVLETDYGRRRVSSGDVVQVSSGD